MRLPSPGLQRFEDDIVSRYDAQWPHPILQMWRGAVATVRFGSAVHVYGLKRAYFDKLVADLVYSESELLRWIKRSG